MAENTILVTESVWILMAKIPIEAGGEPSDADELVIW